MIKKDSMNEMVKYLPYQEYLDDEEVILMKNGTYLDIMQIVCKDLKNLSLDEIDLDNMTFLKLYRTYSDDLKIVGLNFPTDTSEQQKYYKHMVQRTENPLYQKLLQDKLDELETIQKKMTERESYIFIFGDTKERILDNRGTIENTLRNRGLINRLDKKKKLLILYKINNKNTCIN